MKRLSREKMVQLVKLRRKEKNLTQEQVSEETGINRQMIGRLENNEYMPSVAQIEKLAEVLEFEVVDLYEENEPLMYTAFRSSNMSEEEQNGAGRMFDMMIAAKQQLLLRKALKND